MPDQNRPAPAQAASLPTRLFAAAATLAVTACVTTAPDTASSARARNVILFIGDGMGVSTVTATRIFDGQSRGMSGEEHTLAFERFPNVALVKTYNSNQQVPDSAGTATAMLTGQKTRAGMINTEAGVLRGRCQSGGARGLKSLATMANARGMATGVVTTARLTHATPATMYAQSSERDWESDRYFGEAEDAAGCRDIATQLIDDDFGAGLVVALGGGRRAFYGSANEGIRREATDDLPARWIEGAPDRHFVTTAEELAEVPAGSRVLGLFAQSHMTYMSERGNESTEPTLTGMTLRALDLLQPDPDGYFLMVEGGRIDHGHHDGKPGYALTEAQEFNRAIAAALERVDLADTLVLVTADHSHVFTIGGYPTRGNPILGLVVHNDRQGLPKDAPEIAADGQPYTTIGYQNGPGAIGAGSRPPPSTGAAALAQALVPVRHLERDGTYSYDETHGGEDVPLYAAGPGASAARGVMEQDRIFDVMLDALDLTQ